MAWDSEHCFETRSGPRALGVSAVHVSCIVHIAGRLDRLAMQESGYLLMEVEQPERKILRSFCAQGFVNHHICMPCKDVEREHLPSLHLTVARVFSARPKNDYLRVQTCRTRCSTTSSPAVSNLHPALRTEPARHGIWLHRPTCPDISARKRSSASIAVACQKSIV